MHFEVILNSSNTYEKNFSYGLVFIPNPVWVKGSKHVLNMNQLYNGPKYKIGGIKKLLEVENINIFFKKNLNATILVKNIGHGTNKDLYNLKKDLSNYGFEINVFENINNKK